MQLAPSQVNKFIKHNYFTRKIKKHFHMVFSSCKHYCKHCCRIYPPIVEANSSWPEDSKSIKTLQLLLKKTPKKTEICFQKLWD